MERKAQPKQAKQAKASESKQKQIEAGNSKQLCSHSPESYQIPLKTFPKTSQTPPKILPKPFKIDLKSRPDASKSTFKDHSKYKHEKNSAQNSPRGPKRLQNPPKTFPKPSQVRPKTPPNRIFQCLCGLSFSYCKFASFFAAFFNKICMFCLKPETLKIMILLKENHYFYKNPSF